MTRTSFILALNVLFAITVFAQNTVGVLSSIPEEMQEGYNLIYPNNQTSVFLIDNCGRIVHTWTDEDASAFPGTVARLLPDGKLLRSKSSNILEGSTFGAGGAGGILELLDWESNVLWSYQIADSLTRQHHEVLAMPNGNIMCIVWERQNLEEIIENGFDTLTNNQTQIFSDAIYEINPETDSIVWKWRAWDHLIQDFDSTKANYGRVEDFPHRIDINYHDFSFERPDWMHSNALDYNESMDQVMLTVRNFNEIWIIDHSTTTEEAAGSSEGVSSRGGDLLFRWGNPHAYRAADKDDQKLFFVHDANWVNEVNSPYHNLISVFNNMIEIDLSLGQILSPTWVESDKAYLVEEGKFLPNDFDRAISHPDTVLNYSAAASNLQILENGNFLICAARPGFAFELTDDEEVVWEYKVPFKFGLPTPQGTELNLSDNFNNQMIRYNPDYPGLAGQDLSVKGYIETNPNEEFCTLVSVDEIEDNKVFLIAPNPIQDGVLNFKTDSQQKAGELFDMTGRIVSTFTIERGWNRIDLHGVNQGFYLLKVGDKVEQIVVLD